MLKAPIKTSSGAAAGAPNRAILGPRRARWTVVAALVLLVAGAGYLAYQQLLAPPATAAAFQTSVVRRGTLTSTVGSTGTVAALTQARLSFSGSGSVAEVKVKAGDAVTKGQDLASLDTTSLALQVSQARSQLSSAEANLAKLKAGSTAQDVNAAKVALDAAKAKLDLMLAGGRPEEIASAKASLDSARANLSKLKASPTDADLKAAEQGVAAAQASLQQAQNSLATLEAGATPEEIRNAELDVERAKNGLWSAQLSRDGTCGSERVQQYQCDSANASVAAAETGVAVAKNNLAKLMAPAKPEDVTAAERSVASAQAQLQSAQAKLEQAKAGATAEELAAAQAAVTQAEQALTLKQEPYTDADLAAQRQAVAQAEANLATKQTPYAEAELLSAQASVDQAKAAIALAEYNLANATLKAPFDGVIAAVGINVGEAPASPAITLVDPNDVRLDVTVDEADIAKVQAGQKATITFDSIAGKEFQGQVTGVAPSATITSGVATYQVAISIAEPGTIRPGMTGNASIVYGEQQNALLVPNRALKTQGRSRVVEVLVDDQKQTREVKVGVSNDQWTEITEGLAEGDQVVISGTTAAQPRGGGAGVMIGGPVGGPPPGR